MESEKEYDYDGLFGSDWYIINSNSLGSLEGEVEGELPQEETISKTCSNDVEGEEPLKGSCVHDVLNEQESNSSSDIDVIDEVMDDSTSLSIHPMEYSLSSSFESTTPRIPIVSEAELVVHENIYNMALLPTQRLRNPQWKDYIVLIVVSLVLATVTQFTSSPEDDLKNMKKQVQILKTENTDLKNQVLSKIEDDKLFLALEEQITALKGENIKLSNSLQSLILQLEEQTTIFKKENEMREKDPYKVEIDKLKEQVNILQIDNDELQKQLVRMRYGIYSPYSKEPQADHTIDNKKDKLDLNDEKNENSSDVLTEEIKELRKKLYSEVEKLKDWKESVNILMKNLGDRQEGSFDENVKQGFNNKEHFENTKSTEEERSRKTNKKEKKFYDWTWKDLKKNLKGTLDSLPNIDVPEMLSQYVVDKKKVEGVFESVGHYFKKAQEKTKKILDYNEDVKNDVWDFLGDLRKKWANVKNEFFERNYKKAQSPDQGAGEDHKPEFFGFDSYSEKYENENKRYRNNPKKENERQASNVDPEVENRNTFQDPTYQKHFEDTKLKDQQKEPTDNSWMHNRAALRSVLRKHEEEKDSTNWFLRRGKNVPEEEI